MTNRAAEDFDLYVLDPDQNIGYLPNPIPVARDRQISDFLWHCMRNETLAKLHRSIQDGHAMVLRAFAERMASAAIRNSSSRELHLGLVALLLTLREGDVRDGLTILPLFYDAMVKLRLDPSAFSESVRQAVGDRMVMPFVEFLRRPDKNLDAMGYREGVDSDGFRYVRDW